MGTCAACGQHEHPCGQHVPNSDESDPAAISVSLLNPGDESRAEELLDEDNLKKSPARAQASNEPHTIAQPVEAGTACNGHIHSSSAASQDKTESTNPQTEINSNIPLLTLQAQMAKVQALCKEGRVLEAATALHQLAADLELAKKNSSNMSDSACAALKEFSTQFETEPLLEKLRKVSGRMLDAINNIPEPASEKDTRWAGIHSTDTYIGPDFTFDFSVRHCTEGEKEKDGPANQIFFEMQARNFPWTVRQWISVHQEAGEFKKEWIQDCVGLDGFSFDVSQLYSSYTRISLRNPWVPFLLDIHNIREFAVCSTSPIPSITKRPGVIHFEIEPPVNVSDFEGIKILPAPKRSIPMQGGTKFLYIMASESNPHCIDITAVGRLGAPIPKWLAPLSLWKNVVGSIWRNTCHRLKQNISESWDKLPHKDRIANRPDFYGGMGGQCP